MRIKLITYLFCLFGASSITIADYASHSFVDANVEPSECLRAGMEAA